MNPSIRLLLNACIATAALNVSAAEVKATIDNLEANTGKLYVSLCQQDTFMRGRCHFEVVRKVTKEKQAVVFNDVSGGDYAVSVFYDKNGNDKLDTNLYGVPKEPTGTSNNVSVKHAAPSFEQARFTVADDQTVELNILVF